MNAIRLVHLRRLVQQPLRTTVAIVAVAAGVGLLAGVVIARASVGHSFAAFSSGLSGEATLRVEGPVDHGGIPGEVLDRVAAIPEVETAIPMVVARAAAIDAHGRERYITSLGVDCSIEALVGAFGCDPTTFTGAPVVLSSRLVSELGADAVLRTDGGPVPVGGALALPELDSFNGGSVAIWPLAEAQARFTRPDRLDVIYVVPAPGVDHEVLRAVVAAAAGPSNLVLDADAAPSPGVIELLFIGMLLASLLGLIVGGQLVRNTLLLSFEERRTELALVGAVGAAPRRIARGILFEAVLLGVVGGLLGAALGMGIAGLFVATLSDQAVRMIGLRLDLHVTSGAVALAALFGVVAAVLGAIEPTRRATRLDLAGELAGRRPEAEPRAGARWFTALLGIGTIVGILAALAGRAGGSIETWQPGAAVAGLGLAAGCAFRLPGRVAPWVIGGLHARAQRGTGPVRVALGNLVGDPARTGAVTTALAIAVSLAVTLGALVPSIEASGRAHAGLRGEVVSVSAVPLNNAHGVDAKLTDAELAILDGVDGVAERSGEYDAVVSHPLVGDLFISASDGLPRRHDVHRGGDVTSVLAAGEALIGPALARSKSLRPGDRFMFPAVSGPVELTVGAIWASPAGIGRSVYLTLDQFERLVGTRPPTVVTLTPAPGIGATELARRVRAAGLGPHVRVLAPDELAASYADEYGSFADPFRALQRGLLAVAFTATASTLLLAAVQRRREHALLAAIGLGPRGLGAVSVIEVAVLTGVAVATGALAGLVGAAAFALASGVLTGAAFDVPLSLASVPAVAGAVLLVALAAALLPAIRSSRINPAVALREE